MRSITRDRQFSRISFIKFIVIYTNTLLYKYVYTRSCDKFIARLRCCKKKKRSDSYLNARELNSNFFPYSLLNAPTLLFSKKIFKNMKLKFWNFNRIIEICVQSNCVWKIRFERLRICICDDRICVCASDTH